VKKREILMGREGSFGVFFAERIAQFEKKEIFLVDCLDMSEKSITFAGAKVV